MHLSHEQIEDIQKNKDIAAASYIWIFSVIILFSRRESKFIRFHARQATVLFILSVLFWLIPYVAYLNILVLAAMIVGFITAIQGEYYRLPVVFTVLENREVIKDIPKSLFYILKYGWKRMKEIFYPPTTQSVMKDMTEEKIMKLEEEIYEMKKKLEENTEEVEFMSKTLEEVRRYHEGYKKL